MKLSACLTINNRMPEISRAVADSLLLPGNRPDEVVVVLDRADDVVRDGAVDAYTGLIDHGVPVKILTIHGKRGWACPAKAFNVALNGATGDAIYWISSETIQASGSMDMVRQLLITRLRVIFGRVTCSCRPDGHAVEADGTSSGNIMSSSRGPRPVGYMWSIHRRLALSIGGYDQAFSKGIGHEDIDFFLRLWDLGVEFEFNDAVSGLHICHDQPSFKQQDQGIKAAAHNFRVFMERHGTLDPWSKRKRRVISEPGVTIWEHEREAQPTCPPD